MAKAHISRADVLATCVAEAITRLGLPRFMKHTFWAHGFSPKDGDEVGRNNLEFITEFGITGVRPTPSGCGCYMSRFFDHVDFYKTRVPKQYVIMSSPYYRNPALLAFAERVGFSRYRLPLYNTAATTFIMVGTLIEIRMMFKRFSDVQPDAALAHAVPNAVDGIFETPEDQAERMAETEEEEERRLAAEALAIDAAELEAVDREAEEGVEREDDPANSMTDSEKFGPKGD